MNEKLRGKETGLKGRRESVTLSWRLHVWRCCRQAGRQSVSGKALYVLSVECQAFTSGWERGMARGRQI